MDVASIYKRIEFVPDMISEDSIVELAISLDKCNFLD